jgi:hypothetical protein
MARLLRADLAHAEAQCAQLRAEVLALKQERARDAADIGALGTHNLQLMGELAEVRAALETSRDNHADRVGDLARMRVERDSARAMLQLANESTAREAGLVVAARASERRLWEQLNAICFFHYGDCPGTEPQPTTYNGLHDAVWAALRGGP